MRVLKAVRLVSLFLIFAYVGKLVVGRFIVLFSNYGEALEAQNSYLKQVDACTNDETYHTFTGSCRKAERESNKWPFIVAFNHTLKTTHSCIEYPCSDLLKEFMQSWTAIITLAMLLFFSILFLLIYIYNRTKLRPHFDKPKPIIYQLDEDNPIQLIKDD